MTTELAQRLEQLEARTRLVEQTHEATFHSVVDFRIMPDLANGQALRQASV